jgi:hypothetical protein
MKFRKHATVNSGQELLSWTARVVSNSTQRTQLSRVIDMVDGGHSTEEIKAWANKEIDRLQVQLVEEMAKE